jgi:predicted flavoprotein YhiN
MFVIDCVSPLSQKILELKLSDYLTTTNKYDFLITDRDIQGENILIIGKDIHFPFSLIQIQDLIEKNKTIPPKETNLTKLENNKKTEQKQIFKVEEIFEEELPKNLDKKTQEKILTEIEKVFIKHQNKFIDEVQELLKNIKI